MTDLEVCSFLALYFDDGSFNITDWLLPLAREISACNFFIGRSYCTAFPGFYGKQASEIKAKPGTIWSMMSSTDSGLKMSIGLNKVIRSERFQSYTGPRSLMGKFNRCTCKCLPLQRGEVGISFQAPAIHGHQVRYSTEKGIRLALQLTVEAMLLSCYPCNCCRSITFSGLVSLSWTARPDGPFPSHRARWAFPILAPSPSAGLEQPTVAFGPPEPVPELLQLPRHRHFCFQVIFDFTSTFCFPLMETRSLMWSLFNPPFLIFFFSISEVV